MNNATTAPPDTRAINQKLAAAMGWRWPDCPDGWRLDEWHARRERDGLMLPPDGTDRIPPPDFFKDNKASQALVEWLAADRARGHLFLRRLGEIIRNDTPTEIRDPTWASTADEVLMILACPLEMKALAAAAALGEME